MDQDKPGNYIYIEETASVGITTNETNKNKAEALNTTTVQQADLGKNSEHYNHVFKKPDSNFKPIKSDLVRSNQPTNCMLQPHENAKPEHSTKSENLEKLNNSSKPENFEVVLSVVQDKPNDSTKTNKDEVQLKVEDTALSFYKIYGKQISQPFAAGRLPDVFKSMSSKFIVIPPEDCDKKELEALQQQKIRALFGNSLKDEHFEKVKMYCSPDSLRSGLEITMESTHPLNSFSAINSVKQYFSSAAGSKGLGDHLHTIRKYKLRCSRDITNFYARKLKYRGLRFISAGDSKRKQYTSSEPLLVPGKDLLFRVRLYRPFAYSPRERLRSSHRHPVLCTDLLLTGRNTLEQLRDSIQCGNDEGLRIDVSAKPHAVPLSSCKELFPSGFLYINGTFYVDTRTGCSDNSVQIREWARKLIGEFPAKELRVRLDELVIKMGYPEVYMHQGNCEHLFTFSEVRLVGHQDPLDASLYPRPTLASQNHTVYCTTCAEFAAKWVVTECSRVPFDPAFFCDKCFNLYLYEDGKKIGHFKAFPYKNNQ